MTDELKITAETPEPKLRKIVRDPRPYTGLGKTQTQALIDQELHPPPVRLSYRARGFFVDELIEWQKSRPRIQPRITKRKTT